MWPAFAALLGRSRRRKLHHSSTSTAPGPSIPWKARLIFAVADIIYRISLRSDGTVNRFLQRIIDRSIAASAVPRGDVYTSDHVVDSSRNLWIRIFSPAVDDQPLPAVVYFHGGGFCLHSAAAAPYDDLCRRIAGSIPAIVGSVEYRLAPEHKFPAAYEDCTDALHWFVNSSSTVLNTPPAAIFIAGDSAGGNILHHVAKTTSVKVAGMVMLQPFFGGEERTRSEVELDGKVPFGSVDRLEWYWRVFLPAAADRDHEAANVFGRRSSSEEEIDREKFPPAMVCVGRWDPLQDRQRMYCEELQRRGVEVVLREYHNAMHGFYCFPELDDAKTVLADVADFVRRGWRNLPLGKKVELSEIFTTSK